MILRTLRDVLVEVLGQVRHAAIVAPVEVLRHIRRLDVGLQCREGQRTCRQWDECMGQRGVREKMSGENETAVKKRKMIRRRGKTREADDTWKRRHETHTRGQQQTKRGLMKHKHRSGRALLISAIPTAAATRRTPCSRGRASACTRSGTRRWPTRRRR